MPPQTLTVSATELRARFGERMLDIAAGRTLRITRHGRPFARMEPENNGGGRQDSQTHSEKAVRTDAATALLWLRDHPRGSAEDAAACMRRAREERRNASEKREILAEEARSWTS